MIILILILHLLWPGTHPHLHTELAGGGDQPCGVCPGMSEVQESSGGTIQEHEEDMGGQRKHTIRRKSGCEPLRIKITTSTQMDLYVEKFIKG